MGSYWFANTTMGMDGVQVSSRVLGALKTIVIITHQQKM